MMVRLPLVWAAVLVALASCSGDKGTGPAAISVTVTANPPTVPAGNIMTVFVTAVPTGGLDVEQIIIQASGAFSVDDSVAVQGSGSQSVTRNYVIPTQAQPGLINVTATARGGNVVGHAQVRIAVSDVIPPSVNGNLTPTVGTNLVPGDTVNLTLSAADNNEVGWVGYRLGAPASSADSVAGHAPLLDHTFAIVVQNNWIGNPDVTAFARDSSGNSVTTAIGSLTIQNAVRRPTRTAALAAAVRDLVFDAKRNTLYFSEPDSQQVAVLSVASLAFQPPIRLFGTPSGLDLSVGGDSLVVALRRSPYLALVNLVTGGVDTVRLGIDNFLNRGPDNVRVAANDIALVSITFDGSGYGGLIWEYDLAHGTQRQRTDAGSVTEAVPLARSGDRTRILLLIDDSCCPEVAAIYSAASDTVGGNRGTVSTFFPPVSADQGGTHFLIGGSLFDQSLNAIVTLTPSGYGGGPAVIAPDDSVAYMGFDGGYLKVRIPDGTVLERVVLPGTPVKLNLLPNGQTLVAITTLPSTGVEQVSLVDLR